MGSAVQFRAGGRDYTGSRRGGSTATALAGSPRKFGPGRDNSWTPPTGVPKSNHLRSCGPISALVGRAAFPDRL